MGIQGLMTFVERLTNPIVINDHYLERTTVVIDGTNLRNALYRQWASSTLDVLKDDYCSLRRKFAHFFEGLMKCNVEPIVVLDGASDVCAKMDTQLSRMRRRIHDVVDWSTSNGILNKQHDEGPRPPILTSVIFTDVLHTLEIKLVTTNLEADVCISNMARERACPVMSNDSDFFIMDNNDVILIKDMATLPLHYYDEGSDKPNYRLKCRKFDRKLFNQHFPMKEAKLLHLGVALIGNDFMKQCALGSFLRSLNLPTELFGWAQRCRIDGILKWLTNQSSVDSAMQAIFSHPISEDKDSLEKLLRSSMAQYDTERQMIKVMDDNPVNLVDSAKDWFVAELRQAHLGSKILDIFFNATVFLTGQLEVRHEMCSHVRQLRIFRTICHLVTSLWKNKTSDFVTLYHRNGDEMASMKIEVINDPFYDICNLREQINIEINRGWEWLYECFEVSESCLKVLRRVESNNHRLFFLGLHLWSTGSSSLSEEAILTSAFGFFAHCLQKGLRVPSASMRARQLTLPLPRVIPSHIVRELDYVQTMANLQATFALLYSLYQLVFGSHVHKESATQIAYLYNGPLMYKLHCLLKGSQDLRARMREVLPFEPEVQHELDNFLNVVLECTKA